MLPTVQLRWEVVNVLEGTGWELGETATDVLDGGETVKVKSDPVISRESLEGNRRKRKVGRMWYCGRDRRLTMQCSVR